MHRIAVLLAVTGCTSPNTCDRNTVTDITVIADVFFATGHGSNGGTTTATFSCAGGGSGTMTVGGNLLWSGSFTFDACRAAGVRGDALTLTGTVNIRGDDLNTAYWGDASRLQISGNVAGCSAPVDETCEGSWQPGPQYPFEPQGTLCGRAFP